MMFYSDKEVDYTSGRAAKTPIFLRSGTDRRNPEDAHKPDPVSSPHEGRLFRSITQSLTAPVMKALK
jgi:hypothetical protein